MTAICHASLFPGRQSQVTNIVVLLHLACSTNSFVLHMLVHTADQDSIQVDSGCPPPNSLLIYCSPPPHVCLCIPEITFFMCVCGIFM